MARPKKTKPVEPATEPVRPYELAGEIPPDTLLSTSTPSVRMRTETEPAPPAAFEHGPSSADDQLSDSDFVARFATPAELKSFRAAVVARRNAANATGWQRMPAGNRIPATHVLAVCGKCGFSLWTDPANAAGNCLRCNHRNAAAGGMMRPARPAETARWIDAERKRHESWLADAPRRAAELAEFNRRRIQDAGK